jgi:uncharacterized protein (DUF433 family)
MRVPGHPRIDIDPEICSGKPCVAGTRMRAADILRGLSSGDTEADILESFPYISLQDIRACLAFAAYVTAQPVTHAEAAE